MEAFWKILLAIIGILVFIVILIMLIGAWPFFSKKKKKNNNQLTDFCHCCRTILKRWIPTKTRPANKCDQCGFYGMNGPPRFMPIFLSSAAFWKKRKISGL